MNSRFEVLDSTGVLRKSVGGGVGFRVLPACAADAPSTRRVGSYPVTVRLHGRGGLTVAELPVVNGDVHFVCDEAAPFEYLSLTDTKESAAGDSWLVQTFASKSEGVLSAGGKSRRTATALQGGQTEALNVVGQVAPVPGELAGWRVRPTTIGHQFAFAGVGGGALPVGVLARIWARTAAGTWYDTGVDLDPATEPVAYRAAFVAADRLTLVADGAGLYVEADVVEEVG